MAGLSEYERLQIESVLQSQPARPVQSGVGLFLMPDRDEFQAIYDLAVDPAMRRSAVNRVNVARVLDSDSHLVDLCHWLQCAEVIVAELTTLDPHVMYVVGLAHGLGRCPILMAREGTDLPFNLHALRCVEYTVTKEGHRELRERLTRALRVFLAASRAGNGHRANDYDDVT
jgi:hypothetical protein